MFQHTSIQLNIIFYFQTYTCITWLLGTSKNFPTLSFAIHMVQNYENLRSFLILYEYAVVWPEWYRSCGTVWFKGTIKDPVYDGPPGHYFSFRETLSSRSLTAWTCNCWHAYLCTIKTTAFSTWVHRVLGDILYWYASSGCPLTILLPFPRFLRLWKAMHLWCPFWKPSLVCYFQLELSHLYDTYFHFDLRAIVSLPFFQ